MSASVRVFMSLTLLACAIASPSESQEKDHESEIREVLSTYVSAWREADYERLAEIFAVENGSVMWVGGQGGDQQLNSMTWEEILARERRPQPEYGLEWEILSLDIVDGSVAVAKLEISRRGGGYIDFLVFYRISDSWRIVNKTFAVR